MTTAMHTSVTGGLTGGAKALLSVRNLKTHFPVRRGLLRSVVGHVKAVDDVSFDVHEHQTLGLVGESGCGKSTVGRTILRLIPATAGSVAFGGQDVFSADRAEMFALRRKMQIVFQDPVGSLNPRMTVGRIIGEPIAVHSLARGTELNDRVASLLKRVGLSPEYADRYPHEFSGGQRQRIGIARALGLQPRFIVCDEPVSALDVSIQSQILNLLSDLQEELGLSYLFIAHNLAVVEHFCQRVAVMYLGRIVEIADREALYANPRHPYTRALLSAAPMPVTERARQRVILPGEVPSAMSVPTGCRFHPRCPLTRTMAASASESETVTLTIRGQSERVMKKCVNEDPGLCPASSSSTSSTTTSDTLSHQVACWYESQ